MKEKIISIVVVIGMIIVANYPLYSSLKSTANEVNDMVTHMREEIAVWKDDVQKLQGKFEEIRTELLDTVDKISELKNKSEKVNNTIDNLKTVESVDAIKNLFK